MREVSIIGIGITKFGELWDKSLRQLGLETGLAAISDAGIKKKECKNKSIIKNTHERERRKKKIGRNIIKRIIGRGQILS